MKSATRGKLTIDTNPIKCLTQTRSPKQQIVKQIAQLIRNSKVATERVHQEKDRKNSLTFHQLLQEYRNHKNKENSFQRANKTRQISFPNVLQDRVRIKESVYQNPINCIEEMCRLSSEQTNLLNEVKGELSRPEFRKSTTRCTSADLKFPLRSSQRRSRSSSQRSSTQAQTNINLTCDEHFELNDEERPTPEIDPLIDIERAYLPDPYYLTGQQITPLMRAILIDWMMEVSMEFQLKRQTLHLAINYLDAYLSKKEITKQQLQLIGLASLFMSTKVEEIFPRKCSDFERAADFGYTTSEILETEMSILMVLKFKVNPPTYTYWINHFTDQWDIFTQDLYFRKPNEVSYQNFRQLTQLVDCAILDVQTLQYLPRTIVASFMYLILSFAQGVFDESHLQIMSHTSLYLLDCKIYIQIENNPFNKQFGQFVKTAFGFALTDLLPTVQYCVRFFKLEISYDTPPGILNLANTPLEVSNQINKNHYEEFLSFQCYTRNNLAYFRQL